MYVYHPEFKQATSVKQEVYRVDADFFRFNFFYEFTVCLQIDRYANNGSKSLLREFTMHRGILWGILSLTLIAAGTVDTEAKVTPGRRGAEGTVEATRPHQKVSEIPMEHYSGLEVSIGKPHAPLTIIMYYSLTCPHCHEFQEKVLPEIKTEFIDKGLVRFIYRDFPTDPLALKATKLAWCMGKDQYLTIAKKLLATQDDWAPIDPAKVKGAEKALSKIAKEMAISDEDYRKCLSNQNVEDTILRTSFEAQKAHQITAAPAFLVNGKVFNEDMSVKAIQNLLLKMGIHG